MPPQSLLSHAVVWQSLAANPGELHTLHVGPDHRLRHVQLHAGCPPLTEIA